jgi:agmatine deiminase
LNRRLPAEWEPQDAVLLAWPHERSDWSASLTEVRRTVQAIIEAIERFQPVILIRPDKWDLPTNDTWARDFGPITIEEDGRPVLRLYLHRLGRKIRG